MIPSDVSLLGLDLCPSSSFASGNVPGSAWRDEFRVFSKFADASRSLLPSTVFDWPLFLFQPERIDPSASRQGYDVRSDVWSLGITLVSVWGLTAAWSVPGVGGGALGYASVGRGEVGVTQGLKRSPAPLLWNI